MKQDSLNNCLIMHCHKSITDTLDTVKIAKRFACANELRKGHFEKFEYGYALGLVYDEPPTFQNALSPLLGQFELYFLTFDVMKTSKSCVLSLIFIK